MRLILGNRIMRSKAINQFYYLISSSLRSFIDYLLPMIKNEQYENQWRTKRKVKEYASDSFFFKPEKTILNNLKYMLPKMRMLDLGVGTGRTTIYFAPLTCEYVGIDISSNMIDFCKTKFKNNKNWQFKVADVRDLWLFTDKSFDFVLFSFNGIDCIIGDTKDRKKAMLESRRLIKERGFFCFSTHNLNYIYRYCQLRSLHISEIRRMMLLRLSNRKSWEELRKQNKNVSHRVINILGHNAIVPLYISTPKTQIALLQGLGFKKIRVFDVTGKQLELSTIEKNDTDYSLHYLCQT